ncbi:hypothetical protein C7405_11217 [Paraburkholderia caballeronis]|uniref:hypothetical protein n=1 Tax=Paraburkholderia caballeronis TaxID=416943 RepID=UPI0010659B90|nr:hypothetical protein [Paraburkholderia caballeronis]TDV32706.1 hypothetical protein C7405_11217 [Paraburkholderia caballeronis]
MKSFRVAAVLVVFVFAGCAPSRPPADYQAARPGPDDTDTYILHTGDAASRPPRLSVGTSYPDTQLILPWFLNDIINFVNYR